MNEQIKSIIRENGLKQWQVAEYIGVCERTLIVWLRSELSPERKNLIMRAIKELTTRGRKNNA